MMNTSKKIKEGHGHLMTEPAAPESPWYKSSLDKLIAYFSSERGIINLIGFLTLVILSVILSFDYLTMDHLVVKGVSTKDIKAPYSFDVVDDVETQHKIDLVRQNVAPIYKSADPINASIREDFNRIFTELETLSNKEHLSLPEKKRAFEAAIPESLSRDPAGRVVFSELIEKHPPIERWYRLRQLAQVTLDRILKEQTTPADFYNRRDEIITKALPAMGISQAKDPEIARFLVAAALQPNLVEDEEAMGIARQAASRFVKPVVKVFQKGDYIVTQGEQVSNIELQALDKIGKSITGVNWIACLGILLITTLFVATIWQYFSAIADRQFYTPSYLQMVAGLTIVTAFLFKMFIQNIHELNIGISPYIFPLATYALTLSIFTHPQVGKVVTSLFVLLMALTLRGDVYTLAVLLCSSLMGIYVLGRKINFRDRNQLIQAGLYVSLSNVVLITAVHMINLQDHSLAEQGGQFWISLLVDLGWGTVSGFLSAALAIGMLPFLESLFRLVTPYTLMELANHDKPLLKRMQYEAPGTFHHSLMVASMSEAAAEAIGANALLTRVGCLYHDIGKMKRPLFFIENQAYFGVENPHDKLTPRLSKMVVTAHPRDSIEMAKQYGLPKILTHFMTEHHGTLVAGYFYNQACQQEGADKVIKSQFRYPGPKPASKETAIVMMADACESAVRALKNPTVAQIEERIDKIIQQRIDDGQFDNCPLTFKDITLIKETFVRILRGIQHNRIEYQQNVIRELGRKISDSDGSGGLKVISGGLPSVEVPPSLPDTELPRLQKD